MAAPLVSRVSATLRVPPDALWRFFADTDRLNRAVGLPSIRFEPFADPENKGHYRAATRFLGIEFAYEEFPFEWVEGQYHRVLRRFDRGPIRELVTEVRVAPGDDGGSILDASSTFTPRGAIGSFILRLLLLRSSDGGVAALARDFERRQLDAQAPPAGPPAESSLRREAFEQRFARWAAAPVSKAIQARLREYLLTGSDLEVSRMRPFELADRWGFDRFETLAALLYAVKAGLLDLSWNVLCPNCRAPSAQMLSLAELHASSHCDTCKVDFGTDFSASIEARFRVNAGVRLARQETYCIGGPANMPDIVAQLRLAPGEDRSVEFNPGPGPLRVRSFQAPGIHALATATDDAAHLSVTLRAGAIAVQGARRPDGSLRLDVHNALDAEALFVVERETWRESAATAAQVVSLQEFRDLFPEEAVAPGEEIGIATLAVLFTDLKGSTALYEKVGDTAAFSYVMSHFRHLAGMLGKHHGGLVKTMGDAVMASFAGAEDALAAALDMQGEWNAFAQERGLPAEILLKVGLHEGPAIAINNRGRLDYFGGTVNLASRLKDQARGGDIVLTPAIANDPAASGLLKTRGLVCAPFQAQLKGISEEQTLYRLPAAKAGHHA